MVISYITWAFNWLFRSDGLGSDKLYLPGRRAKRQNTDSEVRDDGHDGSSRLYKAQRNLYSGDPRRRLYSLSDHLEHAYEGGAIFGLYSSIHKDRFRWDSTDERMVEQNEVCKNPDGTVNFEDRRGVEYADWYRRSQG